jgi:hypothetical protein
VNPDINITRGISWVVEWSGSCFVVRQTRLMGLPIKHIKCLSVCSATLDVATYTCRKKNQVDGSSVCDDDPRPMIEDRKMISWHYHRPSCRAKYNDAGVLKNDSTVLNPTQFLPTSTCLSIMRSRKRVARTMRITRSFPLCLLLHSLPRSRDRSPVVSLGIFSEANDGTMCPGVDSASKNEYQENSWG